MINYVANRIKARAVGPRHCIYGRLIGPTLSERSTAKVSSGVTSYGALGHMPPDSLQHYGYA